MTGASKILTVSYGTFSCTLEGFDDPFNTMKAIAEYFRDLAADDRYFGAEPPTPDAAMLHRIAEREIHRRVEAKIQENGVILRAGDAAEAPEPVAPRPALAPAAPATQESVAEKLQRIRAKHAPGKPAAPAPAPVVAAPVAVADTEYTEDEHADDLPAPQAAAAASTVEIPAELDALMAEAEADFADEATEEPALSAAELLAEEEAEDTAEGYDLADTFADLPEAEDFDEAPADVSANTVIIEDPVDDSALLAGLTDALATDPLPEDLAAASEEDDLPEDIATEAEGDYDDEDSDDALLSTLIAEVVAPAPAATPAAAPASAKAAAPAAEDEMLSRLGALIDPDDEDEDEIVSAAPSPAKGVVEDAELVLPEEAAPVAEAPAEAPPAETAPQRARARVIRIRRVEPAAAPADAQSAAPAAAPAKSASALSAEEEAALQAELAALEAELGDDLAPARAKAAPAPAADLDDEDDLDEAPVARAPQPAQAPQATDDAVGRLMAQADDAMGDNENRRRQSAIAHLKAAVAATSVDRQLIEKSEREKATRMDAYRDDLERVVRPRRPVAEASTPRPGQATSETAQRPTPLVLVSEQRIDRPKPAAPEATRPVMPVRPRRINAAPEATPAPAARPAVSVAQAAPAPAPAPRREMASAQPIRPQIEEDDEDLMPGEDEANVFAEGTSFAEFAEQLGASELPDLLEAAAVYCAEVLQRPEFSRPLVMRQVVGLNEGENSREDCLRGFGTLLRQGRIAKVKRGMFALTDRSPFLAEARKIAG